MEFDPYIGDAAKLRDGWRSRMTEMISRLYEHAPSWIEKEGDPRGTVARMVLVVVGIGPALGFLAYLAVAYL